MADNQEPERTVPAIVKFKEVITSPACVGEFNRLLGQDGKRSERFLRILTTLVSNDSNLLQCDMSSTISCALQGAQLNLDPEKSLGQFYLIPRGGKCTFLLGYQGMIQLALRSQKVRSVIGRVVYTQDDFEAVEGTAGFIRHKRNIDAEPDIETDFRAAYAVAHFTRKADEPDDYQFIVMPRWQVNRIRDKFSKANTGPWKTSPDAMRAKTAVRQLFKFLQVSAEMQLAIALDEAFDDEIEQPLQTSFTMPRESTGGAASKLGALTEKLQTKAAPQVEPVHVDVTEPEPSEQVPTEVDTSGAPDDGPTVDDFIQRAREQGLVNESGWLSDAEKKTAIDAVRAEVVGLRDRLVGRNATAKVKAQIKDGIAKSTKDTLGIFGYEKIEEVPKAQWGEFRDLLVSTIEGLSGKIGPGGESELRRQLFVVLKTDEAAKAGVDELKVAMNVESLEDIRVLDMMEAESLVAAMAQR